jgi:hypothetical protein
VTLKSIIAKLEGQRSDLLEIIQALQVIDGIGSFTDTKTVSLDEIEKRLVSEALAGAGGNQAKGGSYSPDEPR